MAPLAKPSRTLMVQGTTSAAGKSILVTALCRILARRHISVAPFKPQNMALNSAVTQEGGEIGRAQAVQAEACFLPASVAMNPILLKPNSDVGAQVIVHGQSRGNMDAQKYHQLKPRLLKEVLAAHASLQKHYSVILVEGAGSPAEINLREHDIANMGFAEAVDCPVIIVADIDRGGVFAHLLGTYELLSQSEQQRIKGFVINRFRGDIKLLENGLAWLENRCGVPVLGVIPYITDLQIEAEDSLNQHQIAPLRADPANDQQLKVVIPIYPRASNYTDFDVLRHHRQVDCQFQKNVQQFNGADLIVLPGSKNVRADLKWLQSGGWDKVIQRHLRFGGKLIGICGGYQMLGQRIHDPEGVESAAGSSDALGFLAMQTTLINKKILRKVRGYTKAGHLPVTGYEIHAGICTGEALASPLFTVAPYTNGEHCLGADTFDEGASNADNTVLGTYIHGLFDEPALLAYFLEWAGIRQRYNATLQFDYAAFREQQFENLADIVENSISLSSIYDLLAIERQ